MIPMILIGALMTAPASQAATQPQAPAQAEFTLTIAGPTYHPNGQVVGGTATDPAQIGKSLTYYQTSGATLCTDVGSADSAPPPNAGYGWQVRVTPLRKQADKLVMRVEWQRMWNGGAASAGVQHERELTLASGASVVLDYLSATNSSPTCDAVGMGLQVGLAERRDESASPTTLQTDLWLVHRAPDGTETSQHQTIRASVGDTTPYYFDDVSILTQAGTEVVKVSGHLAPSITDGHLFAALVIARTYVVSGAASPVNTSGGNATYKLDPKVGEVLSFNLPMMPTSQAAGHTFSLRVKTIQIR